MNTTEQLREAMRAESEQENAVQTLSAILGTIASADEHDIQWALARCSPVTRHMLRTYLIDLYKQLRIDFDKRDKWLKRGAA